MTATITAVPRDYARWGAEHGVLFAKRCLPMARHDRRRALTAERQKLKKLANDFCNDGASKDEASLYIGSFERAFAAQMDNPEAKIEIVVKS